jgi:hypothetical protein
MFLNEFRDFNYTRQASEEELTTSTCVLHVHIPELGIKCFNPDVFKRISRLQLHKTG